MSSGITVDIKFKKPNKVYFEDVSIIICSLLFLGH